MQTTKEKTTIQEARASEGLNLEHMEHLEHLNLLTTFSDFPISNKKECENAVPSVPSVLKTCFGSCLNFDKPPCSASNWQGLSRESVLPVKCTGYLPKRSLKSA